MIGSTVSGHLSLQNVLDICVMLNATQCHLCNNVLNNIEASKDFVRVKGKPVIGFDG